MSFQVTQLQGVQGVQETHFWTLCSNSYVGSLKLEVCHNADPKYVISHTQMIFRSVGVNHLTVQLDYEYNPNTYQNLTQFSNHYNQGHDHHDHHEHHEHHHHHDGHFHT